MDIDETGVTARSQFHTFKVARYCAREKVKERAVEEAEWNPSQALPSTMSGAP